MNYRTLGKTGLTVSEIGLGCWQLASSAWRTQDNRDAQRTVLAALDQGCTFMDTAPGYGAGRSESLLGEAQSRSRGRRWYYQNWFVFMVAAELNAANGAALTAAPYNSGYDPLQIEKDTFTPLIEGLANIPSLATKSTGIKSNTASRRPGKSGIQPQFPSTASRGVQAGRQEGAALPRSPRAERGGRQEARGGRLDL